MDEAARHLLTDCSPLISRLIHLLWHVTVQSEKTSITVWKDFYQKSLHGHGVNTSGRAISEDNFFHRSQIQEAPDLLKQPQPPQNKGINIPVNQTSCARVSISFLVESHTCQYFKRIGGNLTHSYICLFSYLNLNLYFAFTQPCLCSSLIQTDSNNFLNLVFIWSKMVKSNYSVVSCYNSTFL